MARTDAAAIANSMANIYKLRPAKQQFTVWSETLKFFRPKVVRKEGKEWFYKSFIQGMTAVRQTKSGKESEFPAARKVDYAETRIRQADLSEFQASYSYTGLAQAETKNRRDAVASAAEDIVAGMDLDFSRKANAAVHQVDDLVMAQVLLTYNATTGGVYPGGAATQAYIAIDTGSIARFQVGMVLDIRAAGALDTWRVSCSVDDVYTSSYGPAATVDIGPGIVVSYDATATAARGGADTDFDLVVDNDEIVLSLEGADNLDGFPSWFSATTDILNYTRAAVGSAWTVPHIFPFAVAGAPVDFDFDDHLRAPAELLANAIRAGRKNRARKNKGDIEMTHAMVAVTTDALASEAASQAGDSARFTMSIAQNLETARRRELFGDIGYEGVVYHHQNLPPIAFQCDPVATPNTIRLLEPRSWFFVAGHEGGMRQPEKLDKDGMWWRYIAGANNRPINQLIAGALMRLELCCDQPKANVEINGVKSSLA